jgi:hypothetical protein
MNERRGRQHTIPIHIDRLNATGATRTLEPIAHGRGEANGRAHDEGWLQRLIFRFPQALPVRETDPGFGPLVPVCLELPTRSGYVDNLDIAHDYLSSIAKMINGKVKLTPKPDQQYVVAGEDALPTAMDILSQSESWLRIIDAYTAKLRDAIEARGT